jgi:hypothetical protein
MQGTAAAAARRAHREPAHDEVSGARRLLLQRGLEPVRRLRGLRARAGPPLSSAAPPPPRGPAPYPRRSAPPLTPAARQPPDGLPVAPPRAPVMRRTCRRAGSSARGGLIVGQGCYAPCRDLEQRRMHCGQCQCSLVMHGISPQDTRATRAQHSGGRARQPHATPSPTIAPAGGRTTIVRRL